VVLCVLKFGLPGHRGVAAEDWYVRKSEKSQHYERVYESVTARSFGSIQLTVCTCWEGTYYYCVNAPLRHNRTELVPRYIPEHSIRPKAASPTYVSNEDN